MVSGVSRNYISGISSGMDTDSLISQMIEASSAQKYSLERARNKLGYQQSMLQDINLKLYELQTKTTDLTFSSTYNSKTVESTDSKVISASVNTSAKAATYNVKVKQLATATNITSTAKLAGSMELGSNTSSSEKMGGISTSLGSLGVNPSGLRISTTASNGQIKTYNIATNADSDDSIQDLLNNINNSIKTYVDLDGKISATYDDKNNTIKFNLIDNSISATITDNGNNDDAMIAKMFGVGGGGVINLSKDVPSVESAIKMRSGLEATLDDLGITSIGHFDITRNGNTETIDLSNLSGSTTVADLVKYLNNEIDKSDALSTSGVATGNNRAVEFRFDESSSKLNLVTLNTSDNTTFSLSDNIDSDFVKKVFGKGLNSTVNSSFDGGTTLANETFATPITNGTFTVDGVQISIDPSVDTLQGVLSRITSMTNINATYDSNTDRISFTRKDGTNNPIGIGSSNDTSNFLSVTGMIAGSQASAARITGSNGMGMDTKSFLENTIPQENLGTPSNPVFANITRTMTINVNGKDHDITYSSGETYQDVLNKIANIDGIESAYYDFDTGRVNIVGSDKGSSNSISISDKTGNLASMWGIATTATGTDRGSTLTGSKSLSDVKTSTSFAQAGFATAVTAGSFTINGVSFTINNTNTQTMDDIINAINSNDKVGVKAQYNPTSGGFILTSTETGNRSIAIGSASDTSNFLSAMGLTSAIQNIGQNCIYSIDAVFGGMDQVSQSNTVTDAVEGLTLNFRETTVGYGETITVKTILKKQKQQ